VAPVPTAPVAPESSSWAIFKSVNQVFNKNKNILLDDTFR
jgi:hypothetical protein